MPSFLDDLRLRWQNRVRPLRARRAFRRLLENPDQTEHVFVVIRSLSGRSFERLLRRVRRDPAGARILAERRDLIPVLSDADTLRRLPEGSLGRTYQEFIEREQISAAGLEAASVTDAGSFDPDDPRAAEAVAFGARLRDMHDLWHVVTGYSRDVLGELALLAFTYEQTRNPGIGYIVRNVERRMRRGGNAEIGDFIRKATERGRAAAFLPVADWESLLERPLDEVRRELRVGEPVSYEERRTPAGEAAAAAAS